MSFALIAYSAIPYTIDFPIIFVGLIPRQRCRSRYLQLLLPLVMDTGKAGEMKYLTFRLGCYGSMTDGQGLQARGCICKLLAVVTYSFDSCTRNRTIIVLGMAVIIFLILRSSEIA